MRDQLHQNTYATFEEVLTKTDVLFTPTIQDLKPSQEQYGSNEVLVKNINYLDQPNIPLRTITINFITAT